VEAAGLPPRRAMRITAMTNRNTAKDAKITDASHARAITARGGKMMEMTISVPSSTVQYIAADSAPASVRPSLSRNPHR
jgi:hypothetical protein